jgi:hypothetical protein
MSRRVSYRVIGVLLCSSGFYLFDDPLGYVASSQLAESGFSQLAVRAVLAADYTIPPRQGTSPPARNPPPRGEAPRIDAAFAAAVARCAKYLRGTEHHSDYEFLLRRCVERQGF